MFKRWLIQCDGLVGRTKGKGEIKKSLRRDKQNPTGGKGKIQSLLVFKKFEKGNGH